MFPQSLGTLGRGRMPLTRFLFYKNNLESVGRVSWLQYYVEMMILIITLSSRRVKEPKIKE